MRGGAGLGLNFGRRRIATAPKLLSAARAGDRDAREQLIQEFTPLVFKTASRAAGRYLRPGVDEEISVSLLAFNEAIDAYEASKGSFVQFAQTVIRRRLVDYFRRHRGYLQELSLDEVGDGDEPSAVKRLVDHAAEAAWTVTVENEARAEEIREFGMVLQKYGVQLNALVRLTPKHVDARERAIRVARYVAAHDDLKEYVLDLGVLPLKRLAPVLGDLGVSLKTVERHRRYILAMVLVLSLDFPYLQSYLESPQR